MGRIADFLKKHGITAPEGAAEFDTELAALDTEPEKTGPTPVPKPELKPELEKTVETKKEGDTPDLKAMLEEALKPFGDRMTALETSTKTRDEQTRSQEIERILDDAISKGKIEPDKRETWKGRLQNAFDPIRETIEGMPDNPILAKQAAANTKPESGKGKDDKGDKPKTYDTAFARGANPALMKNVEEQISQN